MINRALLAGVFAAASPTLVWAESSCKFTGSVVISGISGEGVHAGVLRALEARCEIDRLRPPLIEVGLAVLQDIKELETHPQRPIETWAEPLRQLHGPSRSGYEALYERLDRIAGISCPTSDDEEVQRGNVGRRLNELAISGRVTKQEYDSLVRRLQGN
jgi:hypothetical protein